MDQDFLLQTETARHLFHDYAEAMPIADYHCHISPREIFEDRKFDNLAQAWLEGDHYKWRLMRANGTEEKYITGDAPDQEKFRQWAKTLPLAAGNPLYHWSHLELQRYFGYNGVLSGETEEEVWNLTYRKLQDPSMSARGLIRQSRVKTICTTDDPADSLEWHEKIAADPSMQDIKVLPAFRPDRVMDMKKEDYPAYIGQLSAAADTDIADLASLFLALEKRLDFFARHGCCISDHGLAALHFLPASSGETDEIFRKRLGGKQVTEEEEMKFRTAVLLFLGEEYEKRGFAMQLHYSCRRNCNAAMYAKTGADTGFDSIGDASSAEDTAEFLNALSHNGKLPKVILYSLNPNDNALIDSVAGCFQDASAAGKIQHGAAWWFNDHKAGMEQMLTSLASMGLLGNFIGMLTDSRSFLSYTRHEYFRRILCNLVGTWVENGEYPDDEKMLKKIIQGISYENAVKYFNFDRETI